MSAHLIAETLPVDTADVDQIFAEMEHFQMEMEQLRLVQGMYGRSTFQRIGSCIESRANGGPSNGSQWVMSAARRCMDVAVAAIALLTLLPAMLLIMLLVRLSSPGPMLFRQRRAGRNRAEFTLYKFRSMRVMDCEGPVMTISGDSRITPVGAFLRRHKQDELPQFWNVLIGNMSLVGPRPKLPHHEGLDLPYRPGITGMATLAFRNEEEILSVIPQTQLDAFYEICIKPKKAQLDLEYMRGATFWTDLKLLWRTATSCLFGPDNLSCEETEKLTRLAAEWPDLSCHDLQLSIQGQRDFLR